MSPPSDDRRSAPVRLADLSKEEAARLLGEALAQVKEAAGLPKEMSAETLEKALREAASLKERASALERQLAEREGREKLTEAASGKLYEALLQRLPGELRAKAPAAEETSPALLAQWAELVSSLVPESSAPLSKRVDAHRNGGAPQQADAETWLGLLADSLAARNFKRSHPEEWRRLVARFGGKSFSEVKKLRTR